MKKTVSLSLCLALFFGAPTKAHAEQVEVFWWMIGIAMIISPFVFAGEVGSQIINVPNLLADCAFGDDIRYKDMSLMGEKKYEICSKYEQAFKNLKAESITIINGSNTQPSENFRAIYATYTNNGGTLSQAEFAKALLHYEEGANVTLLKKDIK
jgi:hypothetical protein